MLTTRTEVDPSRILLLGHSEGAVLAASIAADSSTALAGVVLLSVPARAGEDLLVWQAQQVGAAFRHRCASSCACCGRTW
jgi:predicted esterase